MAISEIALSKILMAILSKTPPLISFLRYLTLKELRRQSVKQ